MSPSRSSFIKQVLIAGAFVLIFALSQALPAKADGMTDMWEIIRIIKESGRFDYHMTHFDSEIETKKVLDSYVKPDSCQKTLIKDGKKTVEIYKPNPEAAKKLQEANGIIEANQGGMGQALKLLDDASKLDPAWTNVDTEKGKYYFTRGEYSKALKALDKAIKENPADFTAYKLRGDCYVKQGDPDKAMEDYISSIVYGRNYREAWTALEELGKNEGFRLYNRPFVPLYSFQEIKDGVIRIYFDEQERVRWMPYSFCKAVWRFEPDFFKEKTGLQEYKDTPEEEIDCVSQMIWFYDASKRWSESEKDPMMDRLERIRKRFFVREFVYFEIIAPREPLFLPGLDDKYIGDLKDYIREFVIIHN